MVFSILTKVQKPNEYMQQFGRTKVHFIYPLFKLLDNPPPYPEGNIFSQRDSFEKPPYRFN